MIFLFYMLTTPPNEKYEQNPSVVVTILIVKAYVNDTTVAYWDVSASFFGSIMGPR